MLLFSCSDTNNYNYATVTVINRWNDSIKYKGYFIDEKSSLQPGKQVINVILPNKSKLASNESDTYEMNWSKAKNEVISWVSWGKESPYDRTTDRFLIKNGDKVTIDLSTDSNIKNFNIVIN